TRQTHGQIEIDVDTNSLKTIELTVGHKMVTGFKAEEFSVSGDQKRLLGEFMGGPATIEDYRYTYAPSSLKPDQVNVIEIKFIIFETDIPSQHMWLPESGRYRELWTQMLQSDPLQPLKLDR